MMMYKKHFFKDYDPQIRDWDPPTIRRFDGKDVIGDVRSLYVRIYREPGEDWSLYARQRSVLEIVLGPCQDFAAELLFANIHLEDHRLESGAANMFFAKGTTLSWS